MRITTTLIIVSTLMLSGCAGKVSQRHKNECFRSTAPMSMARISCLQDGARATAEDERRERALMLQRQEAQRRVDIEKQCEGYGFKKQSTAFSQCVMQIDVAQRAVKERQAKLDQERAQRESSCKLLQAQAYLAPTRTGSFAESNDKAMAAYSNCMAGLPPQQSLNVICNKQGKDQLYCFSQ